MHISLSTNMQKFASNLLAQKQLSLFWNTKVTTNDCGITYLLIP